MCVCVRACMCVRAFCVHAGAHDSLLNTGNIETDGWSPHLQHMFKCVGMNQEGWIQLW